MSDSGTSESMPLDPAIVTRIDDRLKILRESLHAQVPPYTSGVEPVKAEDLVIYYNIEPEKNARWIDLGNATEEDLVALTSACQKATFGMNQEDVLDESYRKAGKMDLDKFAARLDILASGLIDAISPDILEGQSAEGEKVLKAEMYKLNVYGPGSFFKAHKDTPRGETMIGSLVVVFPTAHEGGALTLEHGGNTWTFDSAAMLAEPSSVTPKLAYVAFYSDVTHAVEPVTAGYRVTLTYNLYLADHPTRAAAIHRTVPAAERTFEETLRALLADPDFLPTGGFLGYALAHQYPVPSTPMPGRPSGRETRLGHVLPLLKGADARVRTISERVGLTTHVKLRYYGETGYGPDDVRYVVTDDVADLSGADDEYGPSLLEEIERQGILLKGRPEETVEMGYWVTDPTDSNPVASPWIATGNQASLEYMYGYAVLFVRIPSLRSPGRFV
ncbi:hypothetical protein B0H10DRAFT_2109921 [Mycena sp. CBHHK59/15]|nr:hypothetical protein B0H10DRAFT_2109921 [Mycena sp. CBHHK59/15]